MILERGFVSYLIKLVNGFEPLTARLQGECSTTELHQHIWIPILDIS